MTTDKIRHWIDGRLWQGRNRRHRFMTARATVYDPPPARSPRPSTSRPAADVGRRCVPRKPRSRPGDGPTLTKRMEVPGSSFRELLNANKQAIAELITSEHGKVLSTPSVRSAADQEVVEFACRERALAQGGYSGLKCPPASTMATRCGNRSGSSASSPRSTSRPWSRCGSSPSL